MVAIVLCPGLPLLGLRQSIYNLIILLRLKDLLTAPSISSEDGGIGLSIIWSLILDVIKRLYIAGVDFIFRDSDYYPKILSMHCLNIN